MVKKIKHEIGYVKFQPTWFGEALRKPYFGITHTESFMIPLPKFFNQLDFDDKLSVKNCLKKIFDHDSFDIYLEKNPLEKKVIKKYMSGLTIKVFFHYMVEMLVKSTMKAFLTYTLAFLFL